MGWLWPQISVTRTMNGTYSQNICSYWTTTGIKQIQKDLYPLNEAWDNFICLSNFYVLYNFGSCNPIYGQILSHCTGTRNIICFSRFLGGPIWIICDHLDQFRVIFGPLRIPICPKKPKMTHSMTSKCQTSTNYTYLSLPCPTHSLGANSLAKKTWISQ